MLDQIWIEYSKVYLDFRNLSKKLYDHEKVINLIKKCNSVEGWFEKKSWKFPWEIDFMKK